MKTHIARLTEDELRLIQKYRASCQQSKSILLAVAVATSQFSSQAPDNIVNFVEYLTKAI